MLDRIKQDMVSCRVNRIIYQIMLSKLVTFDVPL